MPNINGINTPAPAPAAPSTPAPSAPAPSAPRPLAPAFAAVNPREMREEHAEKPGKSETPDFDFDQMEFSDKPEFKQPIGEKDPTAQESAKEDDDSVEFIMPPKEEDGDEDEETPAEAAAKPATDKADGSRDYSNVDPDIAKILKKLPNATYAAFKDKLVEWKAAADKIPALKAELDKANTSKPRFLAEHPEAYQLQPEYVEASQAYSEASQEAKHWLTQLRKVKAGEAWTEWTGYDQNGRPLTREHPASADGRPDVDAEIMTSQYLQSATAAQQQAQRAAQQLAQGHKQYQQNALSELSTAREKFFPKMDPEKLSGDDKKFFENAKKTIPEAFASHPLATDLGLAFLAVRRLAVYTKGLEAKLAAKAAPNTPAVGPRKPAVGRGGTDAGMIDLNEMFNKDN